MYQGIYRDSKPVLGIIFKELTENAKIHCHEYMSEPVDHPFSKAVLVAEIHIKKSDKATVSNEFEGIHK